MRRIRSTRYIQAGWLLALAVVLLTAFMITPADATNAVPHQPASTAINARIYVTTATLEPMFQRGIEARVPGAVSGAINSLVGKLPQQDRGWALQMANALIQPSVALVSFTPQKSGFATALRLSLYPGDPKAIIANVLFSFGIANSSTVQVTANPVSGSPTLISGPVSTFRIPVGQLNSVAMTPTCGDSALELNLQVPVSLGAQASTSGSLQRPALLRQQTSLSPASAAAQEPSATSSYIEIPAASLAAVGSSVGSFPVGTSFTAKNVQLSVQGSNLNITSDIYWGSLNIGTGDSVMTPIASKGNLAVNVLSTNINVFGLFTINENIYNSQIQQMLDAKLSSAFAGKFYATQAAIGANSHVPCAASNSLILTGTASIG